MVLVGRALRLIGYGGHFGTHLALRMYRNADNRLATFRCVCERIGAERSYLRKARILEEFFATGSGGQGGAGFQGDALLWVQLLIPAAAQRVYNLQNKQMLKLFARIFACSQQEMQLDLEQEGDVSETLRKFFGKSVKLRPQRESALYLQEVEQFLVQLEQRTKEDDQAELFRQLCKQATESDLKIIIRLIKQDLRINAGARHILDGLGPLAYPAYQASHDLAAVVRQFAGKSAPSSSAASARRPATKAGDGGGTSCVGSVQVMTPISPMLANACKSVEEAFKKSPSGLYSEVKYDGERVQIHKRGTEFKFFSRNLKAVMDHKIKPFKQFIPQAFPGGGDMILDSEIILVDTTTGELLPFGSLGAHKKKEYAHAAVCLFVFDCLLFDGEDLTNLPFSDRRQILEENIKPIRSHVQLSECHFLKTKSELSVMTAKVLKANLEGVVLKSPKSTYQPGKRGWLKVKKDYLFGGKMADTADLVVLGAWFGSGKKGGILSIFLMGCYDPADGLWKTVTKVHSGLDDATNDEVHEQLLALMERADANKLPPWLLCKKQLVPDYLAQQPDKMPVWEITGAEFTKSEAHTAAGISIRFPRITRLREDKAADHHNDLPYLRKLYEASKRDINVDLLIADCDDDDKAALKVDSKFSFNSPPSKSPASTEEQPAASSQKSKRKLKIDADDEANEDAEKPRGSSLARAEDAAVKEETKKRGSAKKSKLSSKEPKTPNDKASGGGAGNGAGGAGGAGGHKQLKLDFFATKMASVIESELFREVIAYFDAGLKGDQCQRRFTANGGTIAKHADEANMVFYATAAPAEVDLADCRRKYKHSCRHVSIDWLHDSLLDKQCKPPAMYAVVLS